MLIGYLASLDEITARSAKRILDVRFGVTNVRFHRGCASDLFRSDPKSGHSVVHVRSAALCQETTSASLHVAVISIRRRAKGAS